MNFLKETLDVLKHFKISEADVEWVGVHSKSEPWSSDSFWCSWEEFKPLIDFEYDDGFGCQEIHPNLVIVCTDGWFERSEYDGAECWRYVVRPTQPIMHQVPTATALLRTDAW